MKKIMLIIFCILTTTVFGEIRDNLKIFTPKEIKQIEKLINKEENAKDIKIYLGTVVGKESLQLENPQKTLIILYQKINDNLMITELKFTEDLKMGDKSQEIDILLDSLKDEMFQKNYFVYTEKLIKELNNFITLEAEEEEEHFPEDSGYEKKGFFKRIFSKNP